MNIALLSQGLLSRIIVYDVIWLVDRKGGFERRGNVGKKKRRRDATGTFTSLIRVF